MAAAGKRLEKKKPPDLPTANLLEWTRLRRS